MGPGKNTTEKELRNWKTVFASWPVQAYIEDFSESIAMMITFSTGKNWEPSQISAKEETLKKLAKKKENTEENTEKTTEQKPKAEQAEHTLKKLIRLKVEGGNIPHFCKTTQVFP